LVKYHYVTNTIRDS